VIHFHVTVNTDLEIYSVDQAQAIHSEDLQELKTKAVNQRKAFQEYCNAVKSFSPEKSILAAGRAYVDTVFDICELILNPRWGRSAQVLSFLPEESMGARMRIHYRNCIRWICGVYYRIQHFVEEQAGIDLYDQFDISDEIQGFVRNVVYGYVTEKSSARVEFQLDRMDSAVLGGNRYRFRRMFFNLVMNAVDAMSHKRVGVLNISNVVDGDRIVLRVRDNGTGMPPEKVRQLLTDKDSLDGELHSLGFVFVRQTVADFDGTLAIDSEPGKGTTIAISLPYLLGAKASASQLSECEKLELLQTGDERPSRIAYAKIAADTMGERHNTCGDVIYADYMISEAQFPGAIFAIGVTAENRVDFFTHRPYEQLWNITHEDLSPMFFEATVRGRIEEEDDKTPVLILKAPQSAREYFEFREVLESDRGPDTYVAMVHDEYIRIARKLIATGIPPKIGARVTDLEKFFPQEQTLLDSDPFPLELLAQRPLNSENGA